MRYRAWPKTPWATGWAMRRSWTPHWPTATVNSASSCSSATAL
ncbi:MAG: hypothetical protein R2873_13570 [Caldilineaceae bacterium]